MASPTYVPSAVVRDRSFDHLCTTQSFAGGTRRCASGWHARHEWMLRGGGSWTTATASDRLSTPVPSNTVYGWFVQFANGIVGMDVKHSSRSFAQREAALDPTPRTFALPAPTKEESLA